MSEYVVPGYAEAGYFAPSLDDAISWATKVITIPQASLTLVSGTLYELDVNQLRVWLKDLEDSEVGVSFPDTHRHNTEVTLSGVTYARTLEIINGYTITFEDIGTPYSVRCVGANHNIADVKNVNQVSLIVGNSAGLITVATGGSTAPSAAQVAAAVRVELATELARIDAATTSRLASTATTDIAAATWASIIEAGITAEQLLRLLAAVPLGDATGLETGTTTFKSLDGSKNRVVGTVAAGARTITTRDGT